LFLVPTPIGNLADLSLRAREVLAQVSIVAAEDTRNARALLSDLGIQAPEVVRYDDHTERGRAGDLAARLEQGTSIALVSDAGTPLCSDPGFRLVQAAIAAGVDVVPLPGPCAAVSAVIASGLPPDRWVFLGFPPRQGGRRSGWFEALAYEPATLVLYEAPHRILDTLAAASATLGDRACCLAISLTKQWERFHRGTLAEVRQAVAAEGEILGEMTLVLAGAPEGPSRQRAAVDQAARALAQAGVSPSAIRDALGPAFDVPRQELYQLALRSKPAASDE
jgi:16S rRNA (cytidine1402-2'-O)-methyltransferase